MASRWLIVMNAISRTKVPDAMIVGVPDYQTLRETAIGWMNLAWGIAIDEAGKFQDTDFLYEGIAQDHGEVVAKDAIAKHWRAKQLMLNNAVSLLQQSQELFLKAIVAEISPYLLIVGEPSSWPKPDHNGSVDFSSFKTLDAVQLCRAVRIVSSTGLPDQFIQFYERLRQVRNKIIHLDARVIKTEVKTVLADILTAQKFMFPNTRWCEFRLDYIISTEEYHDKENLFTGDDYTTDLMISEVNTAFLELDEFQIKEFFYYDSRKDFYRCPHCLSKRENSDNECGFVQFNKDRDLVCFLCLYTYNIEEYKQEIIDYFGYMDENEIDKIKSELNKTFSQ